MSIYTLAKQHHATERVGLYPGKFLFCGRLRIHAPTLIINYYYYYYLFFSVALLELTKKQNSKTHKYDNMLINKNRWAM